MGACRSSPVLCGFRHNLARWCAAVHEPSAGSQNPSSQGTCVFDSDPRTSLRGHEGQTRSASPSGNSGSSHTASGVLVRRRHRWETARGNPEFPEEDPSSGNGRRKHGANSLTDSDVEMVTSDSRLLEAQSRSKRRIPTSDLRECKAVPGSSQLLCSPLRGSLRRFAECRGGAGEESLLMFDDPRVTVSCHKPPISGS